MIAAPYPGLRPFRREESPIFFGRETETAQLAEQLRTVPFTVITGAKGCGKSSFIQAGLLANLLASPAIEQTSWHIIQFTPSEQPFSQLIGILLTDKVLGPACLSYISDPNRAFELLYRDLSRNPLNFQKIIQHTALPPHQKILLFIDPLEEIFTTYQQGQMEEVEAFVDVLLENTEPSLAQDNRFIVLSALRKDFLVDCTAFYNLSTRVEQGLFSLSQLSREQLQTAIAKPSEQFGGKVENSLLEQLVNDIEHESEQLLLLQEVLPRIWQLANSERSQNVVLALRHYRQLGVPLMPSPAQSVAAYQGYSVTSQTKGDIVLRVLPNRSARKKVAIYLEQIARQASQQEIMKLIAEPPVVLFKQVLERDARIVVARLEKLGAKVSFVPLLVSPPPPQLTVIPSVETTIATTSSVPMEKPLPTTHSPQIPVQPKQPVHYPPVSRDETLPVNPSPQTPVQSKQFIYYPLIMPLLLATILGTLLLIFFEINGFTKEMLFEYLKQFFHS